MKLFIFLVVGTLIDARDRFLQRFTVQVQEGLDTAKRIADANRLTLETTDWPDLFIFQNRIKAPEYRTKRLATRKPRDGIIKRLNRITEIGLVEVHEILTRKKRDLINPRHPREKWRRQMRQMVPDDGEEESRRDTRNPLVVERNNHSRKIFDIFDDPKWPEQWYLRGQIPGKKLSMRVMDAWDAGYTGKGITVTILDDGIEYDHPGGQIYEPITTAEHQLILTATTAIPNPAMTQIMKINMEQGVIAAVANNKQCVVGAAYHAKVGGVRMLDGDVTDEVEARSLKHARAIVDVYSASWGPDDDGKKVDGPRQLAKRAFEDGAKYGRNGLGSIFVWASGNGGHTSDTCACDGYTNSIYTISVSATTENGHRPWYAESCASTLAATYSSGEGNEGKILTTDLRMQCTNAHTGTSASAPFCAAIVALTLEANGNLTWRDMQHLVVRTSRSEGLENNENEFVQNAAGFNVSHVFGYGLLDAYGLVTAARSWKTVPAKHLCSIDSVPLIERSYKNPLNNCRRNHHAYHSPPTSSHNATGFTFANCHTECNGGCCGRTARDCVQCQNYLAADGVTCVERCPNGYRADSVNVANKQCQDISRMIEPRQSMRHYIDVSKSASGDNPSNEKRVNFLEHVVFKIAIDHHRRGDLEIKLTSPKGTKSTLLERRTYDRSTKGFTDWGFMTVHHWGEDPHGMWTLTILDVPQKRDTPRNGILKKWTLELHGTELDPQPNWTPPPPIAATNINYESVTNQNQPDSLLAHGCRQFYYKHCHDLCAPGGCCGPTAKECRYCKHVYSRDMEQCLAACPFGEYKDSMGHCRQCRHPCTHCYDPDRCTNCAKGYVPDGQGICERQCDAGFYVDETTNKCRACHRSCNRCVGEFANQCKSCARNYYLESGTCRETCHEGFYPDKRDNICRKCNDSCETCTGPLSNECLSCKGQDELKDAQCQSECKDLMKASLCLNVLDFCDVYLVANYCCETCHSHAANPVPPSRESNRAVDTRLLPFFGRNGES